MIVFKFILATILAMIPFIIKQLMKASDDKTKEKFSIVSILEITMPKVTVILVNFKRKVAKFIRRIYEGMHRSDSFRKFFTLLLLIVMLLYQYIDFHIATEVAQQVRDNIKYSSAADSPEMIAMAPYLPLLTKPISTITAGIMAMLIFSYKLADRVLNILHENKKLNFLTGIIAMAIAILSPRSFILSETILILLIGAYIYPPLNNGEPPKGRRPIPLGEEKKSYRKAA